MRKLSISLVVAVGMASFGFAQNSFPRFELSKSNDIGAIGSNYEYLNEVQNGLTPNQIKYLENVVSYWDVTKTEKFRDRGGEPFKVTFLSAKGRIVAFYNRQGKIVRALEQFKNFAMPKSVSLALARQFPNWKVEKNRYSILYTKHGRPKRNFKVQVRKDGQKKWLIIDSSGRIS